MMTCFNFKKLYKNDISDYAALLKISKLTSNIRKGIEESYKVIYNKKLKQFYKEKNEYFAAKRNGSNLDKLDSSFQSMDFKDEIHFDDLESDFINYNSGNDSGIYFEACEEYFNKPQNYPIIDDICQTAYIDYDVLREYLGKFYYKYKSLITNLKADKSSEPSLSDLLPIVKTDTDAVIIDTSKKNTHIDIQINYDRNEDV